MYVNDYTHLTTPLITDSLLTYIAFGVHIMPRGRDIVGTKIAQSVLVFEEYPSFIACQPVTTGIP
jgi:hypothetical protein